MPIGPFPDFDACVAHMMKPKEEGGGGYDEDTARKVCGKMKVELEESFEWTANIEKFGPLLRGKAIHPIKTYHPNEWPHVRVYLEEEIQKSAETLIGKPLYLDHWYEFPESKVLAAKYNDGALEYIADPGRESERIFDMVRKGDSKHVSIQFDWKILEKVNGVAPRNITFGHLSLLKDMEPGDPMSTVEIWESIAGQLKEAKRPPADPETGPKLDKEEGSELSEQISIEDRVKNLEQKIETLVESRITEAEWDTEYVNSLPENAFAVIAPGGEKDDQGKTVPRTLRKLPHHNAQDNLDLPHLRNALARMNQIEPANLQAQAKRHLCGHARSEKAEDLVSEFCGEEEPAEESVREQEEELEKDEHGCVIGKERWDEESQTCVPIPPAELEEQQGEELTVEKIKQKIAELSQRRSGIEKQLYPEADLTPEKRDELQRELDLIWVELGGYEKALAAKIAGQAETIKDLKENVESLKAQIEVLTEQKNTLQEELKKKPVSEAIMPSSVTPPSDILKEVKRLLPERVPMSWGGHYAQLWRNLRNLVKKHESQSQP